MQTVQPNPTPNLGTALPAIRVWGMTEYETAMGWMKEIKRRIEEGGAGEIGVFEHPALLTIGRNEGRNPTPHSSMAGLPLVQTDRGGKITYHGPGQAVVYPVIDIRPYHLRARAWVNLLETIGITVLDEWEINASRRAGCPGIWVGSRKIMAIGCNLQGGINTHGVSLNAAVDLSVYERFDPCGTAGKGLGVTDMRTEMKESGVPSAMTVGNRFAQRLTDALALLGSDAR